SREYDPGWWLPAHVQLLAGMVLFCYTSLGLIPLWQGLYEVDLMNFYVGRLIAHSHAPGLALAVGWPPWSLGRGVGYLFLTYEVTAWSFTGLTGAPPSRPSGRRWRWGLGLAFLGLDVLLKAFFLEDVRRLLAGNLI